MKVIFIFLISFFVSATSVFAVPLIVQYSTLLTNKNKQPRTDLVGRTTIFCLYNAQTGGIKLWEETHTITTSNTGGRVSVMLGSSTPLPLKAIDTVNTLWLEMQLAEESAFSRQQITVTFYAICSGYADTAKYALTANVAANAFHANRADSLGNKPVGNYALINDLPTKVESSSVARNTDSLGHFAANRYARMDTTGKLAANSIELTGSIKLGEDAPKIKTRRYRVATNTSDTIQIPLGIGYNKVLGVSLLHELRNNGYDKLVPNQFPSGVGGGDIFWWIGEKKRNTGWSGINDTLNIDCSNVSANPSRDTTRVLIIYEE